MIGAEAVPFAKSGGLGDVLGSLPKALRRQGINAAVMIPKYQSIPAVYQERMAFVKSFTVPVSWRQQYCGLFHMEYEGVPVYFLDNEYYFKRPYMYGFYDEAERYSFFCRAVLEALPFLGAIPDILHCHDWHAGMVSVLLDAYYRQEPAYRQLRTVFTIHNLKYQGVFPKQVVDDVLGLGWEYFTFNRIEFYDQVNFMKGGLVFSDHLTTVSPSYAEEIQMDYYGEKLNELLSQRKNELSGIVNGIDYELYNPATDPALEHPYSSQEPLKQQNKLSLQKKLGLKLNPDSPVIGLVSRLVSQKGLDLIACIFDEMMDMDVQFVAVGTGDRHYEEMLRQAALRYPGRVSANILFDEALSRMVYAGADLFLMPSLFEPCGIAQLIAMRYGALPVVRETGGLKDTVVSYNEQSGAGNGFSFKNYNAHDMLFTIRRAISLYKDKKLWGQLVASVMNSNFDWDKSAGDYAALYRNLINREANHGIH